MSTPPPIRLSADEDAEAEAAELLAVVYEQGRQRGLEEGYIIGRALRGGEWRERGYDD